MAQSLGDDMGGVVVRVTTSSTSLLGRGLVDYVLPTALEKLKDLKTVKSVKSFAKTKAAIEKVPIPKGELSNFIKECRKMGVQVAVTKDMSKPENVNIIFRAGQSAIIEQAMSNYRDKRFEDKGNRISIKERLAAAIQKVKERAASRPKKVTVIPRKDLANGTLALPAKKLALPGRGSR